LARLALISPLVAFGISTPPGRLDDSVLRSCSSLRILEAPWRCSALLVSDVWLDDHL